jgi:AcrR family transcriptional regulator
MKNILDLPETKEQARETQVLDAAKTVFLRYGFRRVTMQDVATQAGISRPALYLHYANKEELFKAVITNVAADNLRTVRTAVEVQRDVEGKLQQAFEVWAVEPFQLMLASPDASDLVDCAHGFAKETIAPFYAEFESILTAILDPLVGAPIVSSGSAKPLTAAAIAQLLTLSAHAFKEASSSIAELRSMIHSHIALTLAALRKA